MSAASHASLVAIAAVLIACSCGAAAGGVTPACQAQLNAWCNSAQTNSDCIQVLKANNHTFPLYALNDTDISHDVPQWRCYATDALDKSHTHYASGNGYCTRNSQLADVLAMCTSNTTFVDVFTPGEGGYPCIRIPSILLSGDQRTLLAYAECRNWSGDGCDPGRINKSNMNRDICTKSSTDGGATWSPLRVIVRDAMQPTPVWDAVRKRLVMNFNVVSTGDNVQMFSTDNGETWSPPVSLKQFLGSIDPTDVGPGIGIQLSAGNKHAGRLLFIGHHGPYEFDTVWYSDDGGATYSISNANLTFMDEAQLVELPNGDVLASLRNNHLTPCNCTALAISHDGGASFGPIFFAPELITPVCMASVLRGPGNNVFFSNPASTVDRVNGVLRRSTDGVTWDRSLVVWPGAFAYSCLTTLPPGAQYENKVGLLWETSMPEGCVGESCRTVFSILPADF